MLGRRGISVLIIDLLGRERRVERTCDTPQKIELPMPWLENYFFETRMN
jgi:hypothetical protein